MIKAAVMYCSSYELPRTRENKPERE